MTEVVTQVGPRRNAPARPASEIAIAVHGVSKVYGATVALSDADLVVESGTIHALLGENGAGKSTLVRILAGIEEPDGGEVRIFGQPVHDRSVHRRKAFIHQDLGLFPSLSVATNMALGSTFSTRLGVISDRRTEAAADATLRRLDIDIDPRALVGELPLADQTAVAIARALHVGVDLIVLDEPTAYLDSRQVRGVLDLLTNLKNEGVGCLLITHRAGDILSTCDHATVLRNGRTVGSRPVAGLAESELVRLISGHVAAEGPARGAATSDRAAVLELREVAVGSTEPISLTVGAGEIVGVCGLADAGATSIGEAVFGLARYRGDILVEGAPQQLKGPEEAIEAGVAYVPSDRRRNALALNLVARENIFMRPDRGWWKFLRRREESQAARELMHRFRAVPDDPERVVSTFSGGNQQKIVLAKWLDETPRVLVLNDPTAGVDLAAKAEIHAILRETCDRTGLGVLLISSDFGEIADVADRSYVMRNGRIVSEVGSRAGAAELVELAYGGAVHE